MNAELADIFPRYNAHIRALLEGFGHLTERLQETEEKFAELKNLREKELEEFRGISEDWVQREEGYKAEIKRLELVLAKESKDGVASVALARHESLIDRSGSKRFRERLKRARNSHQQGRRLALQPRSGDGRPGNEELGLMMKRQTLPEKPRQSPAKWRLI